MSDVRADLGYMTPEELMARRTAEPAPAPPAAAPAAAGADDEHTCRACRRPALVLHPDPRSGLPDRTICSKCQGYFNARKPRP